jgi:hypothetical protein
MTITTSAAAGRSVAGAESGRIGSWPSVSWWREPGFTQGGKQPPLCDGCLSAVEFCGNELKICGNTNCLCPLHCVKRWHDLAQRIARALDCNGFFLADG